MLFGYIIQTRRDATFELYDAAFMLMTVYHKTINYSLISILIVIVRYDLLFEINAINEILSKDRFGGVQRLLLWDNPPTFSRPISG